MNHRRPKVEAMNQDTHESKMKPRRTNGQHIRRRNTVFSLRGSLRRLNQTLFDRVFCVFFWRKRLLRSLEYTRNAVIQGLIEWGIAVDYSPDSLERIDSAILGSLQELEDKEEVRMSRNQRWGYYEGLGSYFGEVIIRNITGEWVFPSRRLLWRARISRDPSTFYDRWCVNSRGILIPAIKIARLRQDGSGRVRSLSHAYEQIAFSGSWSEALAHTFEARKAR